MVTLRQLVLGAIPGLIVFAIFWLWLAFSLVTALAAGMVAGAIGFLLVRILYDDAEGELAAWRSHAPDLADADGE